jgi:2-methylaconitate cis-trans-isomerase PrpF
LLEKESGVYNRKTAAILRTARTIMDGIVYVRKSRVE